MDETEHWVSNERMRIMADSPDGREDSTAASPPTGFTLGTVLILFMVLGISASSLCCYHWESIRGTHNRRHYRSGGGGGNSSSRPTSRSNFTTPVTARPNWSSIRISTPLHQSQRSLPVMMPGDEVPKFLAMPSPHAFAPQISETVPPWRPPT